MNLVVSPYHLTTCDPAALAAILLADRVVTMMPVPPLGIDRESVQASLRRSPEYARLLESWRWAIPLFRDGVITSMLDTEDAAVDAEATRERVANEEAWQPLRPFVHQTQPLGDEYLDRVSGDMLKGGPDPGWSLPIIAGLDALAARHGMLVVRAGGGQPTGVARRAAAWRGSAAQVAEWRLGKQLFALAVPVFKQAGAHTLLRAREALRSQLKALRGAIGDALGEPGRPTVERLRQAARDYATAFEGFIALRGGHGRDDAAGRQTLDGFMRLTAMELPADAALLAARVASAQLRPTPKSRPGPAVATLAPEAIPRPLRALVIESMSGQPRGAA